MGTSFFISAGIYPNIYDEEETQIASAVTAGDTAITVDNNDIFAANDYIILGTLGKETCELVKISSVTGSTTITLTTGCTFAHVVDEKIRKTPFNQIKFYYCSTSGGTYAADGSAETMQVDNKNLETLHETTLTNARTMYWKITYYNSTTTDETSQSDSEPVYGATVFYCDVADIFGWLGIDDTKINPNTVNLMIEAATAEIEDKCNTVFYTATATDEYHDGKGDYDIDYFLENIPILSMTSLSTSQSDENIVDDSISWDSLTEDDEYTVDYDTGKVRILNSSYYPPDNIVRRLKATYTYGTSTTPYDIRKVCILMVSRDLMQSNAVKNWIEGRTEMRGDQYTVMDSQIDTILNKHKKRTILNT